MTQLPSVRDNSAHAALVARWSETRPATADQCRMALRALFIAFPTQDRGDPETMVASYLLACQGFPLWSVEDTAKAFLSGKVESHDGRFLPTSAQFGRELSRLYATRAIKPRSLTVAAERSEGPPPEAIARIMRHWEGQKRDIWSKRMGDGSPGRESPEQAIERLKAEGMAGFTLSPETLDTMKQKEEAA